MRPMCQLPHALPHRYLHTLNTHIGGRREHRYCYFGLTVATMNVGSVSAIAVTDRMALLSHSTHVARLAAQMSITWLLVRRRTARLAYVLTALNVAYLGVIWHDTRDLATPVTAALLLAMAELLLLQHCPNGLGAQAGGEGSSSSGGNGAE